jgi:hypothetical protein
MLLDCPAHMDHGRAVRCGLPADVGYRFTMRSADGPLESAMIKCPLGYYFSGPVRSITWDGTDNHDPRSGAVTFRSGRGGGQGSQDGRDGGGGSAVWDFPAGPKPEISRPNTAPAYYLGHPARLWITLMRRRRRRTTSVQAVTSGGKQTPSRPGAPRAGAGAETASVIPATTPLPVMQAP